MQITERNLFLYEGKMEREGTLFNTNSYHCRAVSRENASQQETNSQNIP